MLFQPPRNFRVVVGLALLVTLSLYLLFASSDGASPARPSKVGGGSVAAQTAGDGSCTTSYDGKKPVTQYVVMIDAGSSGSRVHVYEFSNCGSVPKLMREEFKMLEPGLSSYENDPEAAARSLDELMRVAVEQVPKESQACTPVAVKATAGLRLLGEEKSSRILEAVKQRLEKEYPFVVDTVETMDGSDEGVYAWITTNYLLGKIGSDEKVPTVAVFDLGGGSTQIVFEPEFSVPDERMPEGDHKYTLDFAGRHFELYQHSHLGYGLNAAVKQINALAASTSLKKHPEKTVVNPCLPPQASLSGVEVELPATEGGAAAKRVTIDMTGPKEASTAQCRRLAEDILNKGAECKVAPCSFNGVHQPSLTRSFPKDSDVYIFSFFYDRTFPLGMPNSFSIDELKDLTSKVCRGEAAYDSFEAIDGAVEQLRENPKWCAELNYMMAVLHTGYEIPIHREVKIAKKINGNELGWCLGASLPLLDKSVCKGINRET
ncbi:guanosine-diphosphatase [Trichomonascus vanleenenianus]|uniref:guanosine-diphosphatase n=1 Tax=Trichomonascus vanleenenianus TaxID=2268995 RepID=UPI003ECA4639